LIIGIFIAFLLILAIIGIVRKRCIKKRENGWEIRKSVSKCGCLKRPPRTEIEGIKRRLEKANSKLNDA
jgi:hypothetical protein